MGHLDIKQLLMHTTLLTDDAIIDMSPQLKI